MTSKPHGVANFENFLNFTGSESLTSMAQNLISNQSLQLIILTLRLLGQDYPAIESDVTAFIRRLEGRFKYRGPDRDCVLILKAIRAGYHTAVEISEKTRIPHSTACKRLKELVEDGVLRTNKQVEHVKQHGGDRKTLLFWLTENWRALYDESLHKRALAQTNAKQPKPKAMAAT